MSHHHIHHTPGRIRIRCGSLKRNPYAAAAATALVEDVDGVERCEVNPLTGSLTATYDRHRTDGRHILAALRHAGYCGEAAEAPAPGYAPVETNAFRSTSSGTMETVLGAAGSTIGKIVVGTLVEKAVERSALALIGALL